MKLFSAALTLFALFFTFSAKAQTQKDSLLVVEIDTTTTKKISLEKGKE